MTGRGVLGEGQAPTPSNARRRCPDGQARRPTDLPLDDDGLVDEAKAKAAVDAPIAGKPQPATRRPIGEVAHGARPEMQEDGLAALLRRGA